jgi:hypothetical protein
VGEYERGGGGEEEGASLVLAFTILSKVISNIGWFIMWVQAIEVCYKLQKNNKHG